MPIIREFQCLDCRTAFESTDPDPSCPTCTGEAERAFFTPPAIRSGATSVKDEMVKGLAADFGLSDLNSNKHGEAVAKRPPANGPAPTFATAANSPMLGKIPNGHRDGFSSVMPAIQQMGGPTTWTRKQGR